MNTSNKIRIGIICLLTVLINNQAYTQIRTKADFDNGCKFKLDSVNNYSEKKANDNNSNANWPY